MYKKILNKGEYIKEKDNNPSTNKLFRVTVHGLDEIYYMNSINNASHHFSFKVIQILMVLE